jgi:hypothetical protein
MEEVDAIVVSENVFSTYCRKGRYWSLISLRQRERDKGAGA